MPTAAQARRRGPGTVSQDGDAIRSEREASGLTQQQLARKVGCSSAYVAQFETRTRVKQISTKLLARIARVLGCKPADLLLAESEAA